jgi:DNA polymerase-3 subunit gamma/tau
MALYNKYRPASLSDICGQEHVKKVLANQVKLGKPSQAYLFFGPAGTGKTTVARIFASMLNCSTGSTLSPPPDDRFVSQIMAGKCSIDVEERDAASNRGIDDAKELRETARFPPMEMKYKIYIIDECHQLTNEAWNALLKVLEEPPPYVVFIFCTTSQDKVIETIQTRTMMLEFRSLSAQDIAGFLSKIAKAEGAQIDDDAIRSLATTAKGSLRMAISRLENAVATGEKVTAAVVSQVVGCSDRGMARDFVNAAIGKKFVDAVAAGSRAVRAGVPADEFMREVACYCHDMMCCDVPGYDLLAFGNTQAEVADVKNSVGLLKAVLEKSGKSTYRPLLSKWIRVVEAGMSMSVFNQQQQFQLDVAYADLGEALDRYKLAK